MNEEDMKNEVTVSQARLDQWRAYAEQTRTDLFTLRQLVASGQKEAAVMLAGSVIDQSIMAGLDMEDAGANRPAHLPAKPAPGTYDDDAGDEE